MKKAVLTFLGWTCVLAVISMPSVVLAEEEDEASAPELEWLTTPESVAVLLIQEKTLVEAIVAYDQKFGRLPKSLADLIRIPDGSDEEEPVLAKLPVPKTKWHKGKKIGTTTYPQNRAFSRIVVIEKEGERGYVFKGIRAEDLKDTGGWGYSSGTVLPGGGPASFVLFLSCTHPAIVHDGKTFTLRQVTSSGAYKQGEGWQRLSEPKDLMKAMVAGYGQLDAVMKKAETDECAKAKGLDVCQEAATKGNINSIQSAISIYYGDSEGIYPDYLDTTSEYIFSRYLDKIPSVMATHAGIGRGTIESPTGNQVFVTTDEKITTFGKGWRYNPRTGRVFVNSCATDSRGIPYSTYGY